MILRLRTTTIRPLILVIGGGSIGSGSDELYNNEEIRIVGTDVYASPHTTLVCDAHRLPFEEQSFDGVWIQAVLEHVIDPQKVVKEIHRVLKSGGLVYADTPFMQQVHEAAFDFTRFTLSGHRWLFREFNHIDSGTVSGPGIALLWSIAFFVRAHGSFRMATVITALFFWVRLLDRRTKRGPAADGASAVFFYGSKSSTTLRPRDMITYYQSQR
jgi:SAM-dependent methyltransferase